MQELEMITKINKHYSDFAKRRMLEASVNSMVELKSVWDIDDLISKDRVVPINYQQYKDNQFSQAKHLDNNLKVPKKPRHKINMAECGFHEEDFFDYGYVNSSGDKYYEPEEANYFDLSITPLMQWL